MKPDYPLFVPGTHWQIHDRERPQPPVVTPGDLSSRPPVLPPSDAIVLFDGTSLADWESVPLPGEPAAWQLNGDGTMTVVKGTGDIRTRRSFGDIQLHLEWSAPTEIEGEGQGRGNSGVFLMDRYEVQILDCYQNETYPDGTTAAIYGQRPPLVNACCPPGQWHIYDIIWQSPCFHAGNLIAPPRITVLHNGIVVHHAFDLHGPTRRWQLPRTDPHPSTAPLRLQDHKNPVRFRNIWVREL